MGSGTLAVCILTTGKSEKCHTMLLSATFPTPQTLRCPEQIVTSNLCIWICPTKVRKFLSEHLCATRLLSSTCSPQISTPKLVSTYAAATQTTLAYVCKVAAAQALTQYQVLRLSSMNQGTASVGRPRNRSQPKLRLACRPWELSTESATYWKPLAVRAT